MTEKHVRMKGGKTRHDPTMQSSCINPVLMSMGKIDHLGDICKQRNLESLNILACWSILADHLTWLEKNAKS